MDGWMLSYELFVSPCSSLCAKLCLPAAGSHFKLKAIVQHFWEIQLFGFWQRVR